MTKLGEKLRAIRIFNNWDILVRFGDINDVSIEYHRPAEGRMGWCETRHTRVWSPHQNPRLKIVGLKSGTSKDFQGSRSESLPAALAWASNEFGHTYVPSPHGGYIPKHVLTKIKAALKETTA